MKYFSICSFVLVLLINNIDSFDVNEYASYVGKLSLNATFLEEYMKWSFDLFSQPDYLYGKRSGPFPCSVKGKESHAMPTSVHQLRPADIKCVAGLGDSLTAGLGAHAVTPLGLIIENRGLSWSIGGDDSFDKILSLPNLVRQYDPDLDGYSVKTSIIFLGGQNSSNNHLNVAKSGDRSDHMIGQARMLLERFHSNKFCDFENDWKIITLFVGGNDLCGFCRESGSFDPDSYAKNIEETLSFLHANIPKAFVNLVLVLDMRGVLTLNAGGLVCQLLHKKTCPCAAYPTQEQATRLDEWMPLYHQKLVDLVNSGRFDTRDDFTVVIQPFFAHTEIPRKINGDIDFSFFAPDCFHLSGKGHARAALALWNNMLEPVGEKEWRWHEGEFLRCPSDEQPYFFTSKNSPKRFESVPTTKSNK